MKKSKYFIGALLLVGFFALSWVQLASGHSFNTGTNVVLGQNQQINESVFAAGNTVDINSEVFGDVYCAGQTITISGAIHGDVLCAGQTVRISGTVDGDVRLAGQTVTVGAHVKGNATIAGQSFNLESIGAVDGDLTIGSSTAVINGPIGRDIAAGAETVTIANKVGRNIKGSVTTLNLNDGAEVSGNITYTSKQDLNKASSVIVSGNIERTQPTTTSHTKRSEVFGFGIGWFIYLFLAMLLTSMAIALLFPRALQAITNNAMPRPWKALLTGFLAIVAVPAILIVMAITIIGIPLMLLTALVWAVILMLSGPVFGYYIGRLILKDAKRPLLVMLAGSSVLLAIYFIPIVGLVALLAAACTGSGMLLLEIFHQTPKPVYTQISTAPAVKKARK